MVLCAGCCYVCEVQLCDNCGGGLKMGERPSNGGRDALCTLLVSAHQRS